MNGFLSNINSLHKNIKTRLISDFFISIVFMGIGPFFTIYLVEGKKQFIKTNWKLAGILFGFIGFIFAIVQLALPFFI